MKSSFLENYRIKLIVLTAATVFWFAVITENEYEHDFNVPIRVVNVPDGKTVVGNIPETARVRFEGHGKALLALMFSGDSRLVVDLSNLEASSEIDLNRTMVRIPRRGLSVRVKQLLAPHSLKVNLSDLQHKRVAVKPNVKLSTLAGYTIVGEPRTIPDSVMISGPEETVKTIDEVTTEPAQLENVRKSIREKIELASFSDSAQVQFSRREVEFVADVQKLIELPIKEIPVEVKNAPKHLIVTPLPSTLSLIVEGGEQLLFSLKRENIHAYIDFNRKNREEGEGYPVQIEMPEGVRYREVKPTVFKLMLERENRVSARD